MPRIEVPYLDHVLATGEGAPSLEEKAVLLATVRAQSEEHGRRLERALLESHDRAHQGLAEAREVHEGLRKIISELTSSPWHPAVFLQVVMTSQGPRALVARGGTRSLVGISGGIDGGSLAPGEEVLLARELNVILDRSPWGMPPHGETATFDRRTADGRLVLRWRDEEVVVEAAAALRGVDLEAGDQIRWDRGLWMAFEKIERLSEGRKYLLKEVDPVGPDQVGGQDENLDRLLTLLTARLLDPKKAEEYMVNGRNSILLIGPPGGGKTLMARVAASEIARLSGQRCRFGVVKPGEWESKYVGETQENIRNCFQALREAAEDGMAVLFLDEVEVAGRIRGGMSRHHADAFLGALLAELDGFKDRSNVAILAASNRKDLIDPALLERLGEAEVVVSRPDMKGAEEIFAIHLPAGLPFNPDGSSAPATRRQMIRSAVSMLYDPNGENAVSTLHFRDSQRRVVYARELTSGRLIEQICREARQAAYVRDLRGGDRGLTLQDIQDATANAIRKMATTLTPYNVHVYLPDLPQDLTVTDVRPIRRRVDRPHRYLNLSAA